MASTVVDLSAVHDSTDDQAELKSCGRRVFRAGFLPSVGKSAEIGVG